MSGRLLNGDLFNSYMKGWMRSAACGALDYPTDNKNLCEAYGRGVEDGRLARKSAREWAETHYEFKPLIIRPAN